MSTIFFLFSFDIFKWNDLQVNSIIGFDICEYIQARNCTENQNNAFKGLHTLEKFQTLLSSIRQHDMDIYILQYITTIIMCLQFVYFRIEVRISKSFAKSKWSKTKRSFHWFV